MPDEKTCLFLPVFSRCQGHLKLAMGDDENYGFVGKEFNAFGEFTLATHEDDRLLVQLDMSTAMWRPIGIDLVVCMCLQSVNVVFAKHCPRMVQNQACHLWRASSDFLVHLKISHWIAPSTFSPSRVRFILSFFLLVTSIWEPAVRLRHCRILLRRGSLRFLRSPASANPSRPSSYVGTAPRATLASGHLLTLVFNEVLLRP